MRANASLLPCLNFHISSLSSNICASFVKPVGPPFGEVSPLADFAQTRLDARLAPWGRAKSRRAAEAGEYQGNRFYPPRRMLLI
jgi:hypothetical protein